MATHESNYHHQRWWLDYVAPRRGDWINTDFLPPLPEAVVPAAQWPELIGLWSRGDIDTDQLIGQALQWGRKVYTTTTACQQEQKRLTRQLTASQTRQAALEKDLAALQKRVKALEALLSPKAKG